MAGGPAHDASAHLRLGAGGALNPAPVILLLKLVGVRKMTLEASK